MQEFKEYAKEIEITLIVAFRPTFLNFQVTPDYIHFVLSSPIFEKMTIDQRASLVFSKLRLHDSEILDKVPVVVEVFSTKQIEDLIEYYLNYES